MTNKFQLIAHVIEPEGERSLMFAGRDAWALQELVKAGPRGVTPINQPAPRWSGYVFNLRRAGIMIETIHERHRGPFPGTHARYVLKSNIRVEVAHHGAAA